MNESSSNSSNLDTIFSALEFSSPPAPTPPKTFSNSSQLYYVQEFDHALSYFISTPEIDGAKEIDGRLPTLVFIPSLFLSTVGGVTQFEDPILKDSYNLVSVNLPGHGDSVSLPPDEYNLEICCKMMATFIRAVCRTATVMGSGVSSSVAVGLAVKYPDVVEGLILNSYLTREELSDFTPGFAEADEAFQIAAESDLKVHQMVAKEALDALVNLFFSDYTLGWAPALVKYHGLHGRKMRQKYGHKFRSLGYLALSSNPFPYSLSQVRCPVLLVQGELISDTPMNKAARRECEGALQSGTDIRWEEIPAGPALCALTHPAIVNRVIHSILPPSPASTLHLTLRPDRGLIRDHLLYGAYGLLRPSPDAAAAASSVVQESDPSTTVGFIPNKVIKTAYSAASSASTPKEADSTSQAHELDFVQNPFFSTGGAEIICEKVVSRRVSVVSEDGNEIEIDVEETIEELPEKQDEIGEEQGIVDDLQVQSMG